MAGLLALSVLGHCPGHKGRRSPVAPALRSVRAMSIFDRPSTVVRLTVNRRIDLTHQSVIKTTFLLYVRSSGAISAG